MHESLIGGMPAPMVTALLLIAGAGLGLVFYGGLWWTVSRAASFRHPALSVLSSMVLRMSIALVGFYLVSDGQFLRLLLCLAGFVLARALVSWRTRLPSANRPLETGRGARDAP